MEERRLASDQHQRAHTEKAADALFENIDVPHLAFRFDKTARHNPSLGFLALADRFVVTGDSASMIAEAVSTGRPVSIFDVRLRRRSRWMTRQRAIPTAPAPACAGT